MMYVLYQIGYALSMALPVRASYAIAAMASWLTYHFSRKDRTAVIMNLRIILGDTVSDEEIRSLARQVFLNFAKYLVDFFRFSKLDDDALKRLVRVKGQENVEEAIKVGKGVIFLSAHLGNWELAGSVVSSLGYPVAAVALTHQDRKINEFFNRQRMIRKVRPIEIGASLKSAYKVLKSKGYLGLLGDRDFTRNGIPTIFFGRTAFVPKGPAALSYRLGSPIVPAYLVRNGDDTFTFYIEKPIKPGVYTNEEEAMRDLTGKSIASIESYIRRYPMQWFAFKNIWKKNEGKDLRPHTVI